jgi:hypothetical protein
MSQPEWKTVPNGFEHDNLVPNKEACYLMREALALYRQQFCVPNAQAEDDLSAAIPSPTRSAAEIYKGERQARALFYYAGPTGVMLMAGMVAFIGGPVTISAAAAAFALVAGRYGQKRLKRYDALMTPGLHYAQTLAPKDFERMLTYFETRLNRTQHAHIYRR